MATLHQLRCFIATLEHGSFTRAAEVLGLAQPSLSEQVRSLERSLSTTLFHRVGRGVMPTEAARALEPHAQQALNAVDQGRRAAASADGTVSGTIRFGIFGGAHLYLTGQLVADMRARFPHARLALIGQNSLDTIDRVRRGHLEAALVALPVHDNALHVRPVVRDEIVYVSADPDRVTSAMTPSALAGAPLVLSQATWGDDDFTRSQLRQAVQSVGGSLQADVEVEDAETALEVAALGIADAITARSILRRHRDRLSAPLFSASLDPPLYDHFAIVHRPEALLSWPMEAVIEMATVLMRQICAP